MKRAIIISTLVAGLAIPTAIVMAKGFSHHGGMKMEMFDKMDSNQDGKLSLDEMPDHRQKYLDKMDMDNDGFISKEEAEAKRGGHHKNRMAMMMQRLDSDGDGKITRSEFTSHATEMFNKADENGDGVVTEDEIGNMKPSHRRHHRSAD